MFGDGPLGNRLPDFSQTLPVYLKGGHSVENDVEDTLYNKGRSLSFSRQRIPNGGKHGSGCVLSAAITAQLALGKTMEVAAEEAFHYTGDFLTSSDSFLGYHVKRVAYEEN